MRSSSNYSAFGEAWSVFIPVLVFSIFFTAGNFNKIGVPGLLLVVFAPATIAYVVSALYTSIICRRVKNGTLIDTNPYLLAIAPALMSALASIVIVQTSFFLINRKDIAKTEKLDKEYAAAMATKKTLEAVKDELAEKDKKKIEAINKTLGDTDEKNPKVHMLDIWGTRINVAIQMFVFYASIVYLGSVDMVSSAIINCKASRR